MKKTSQSSENQAGCQKKTTIGGQALIEGLMMIGPDKKAMAIRKPDGSILVEYLPMTRFTGLANIPFIRGSVRMFQQLVSGTKALLRSAEFVEEDEAAPAAAAPAAAAPATAAQAETIAEPDSVLAGAPAESASSATSAASVAPAAAGKTGFWPRLMDRINQFVESHTELMLYLSAITGILFSVVLFILLPNLLTSLVRRLTGLGAGSDRSSVVLLNLIEGAIRIAIFVGYLTLASKMQEIRRVWMYHGAEHKTIACYEAQQPLTVENVRTFSRYHPRCGTAFMFIVILVSIIVFSLIGWWNPLINLLVRFALVPLIAGIAYEIIRITGRHDTILTRIVAAPGLWLQRLTTAEPTDKMLEVAIVAMEAVLPQQADSDKW